MGASCRFLFKAASGMLSAMITILLSIFVPIAIIVGLVVMVVRRGFQMKLLVQDGVAGTGVVTDKIEHPTASGSRRSSRRIAYEYRDAAGQSHRHTSLVTSDFWNAHTEGGPIDIVYSRSQPAISAPAFLVELSRQALQRK
jgi:hypothetical protein